MKLTPQSGELIGAEGSCPPLPFIEIDSAEGHDLIERGLAAEFMVAEPEPKIEAEAPVQQASVGADGAGSGEAAPAAAPEPTIEPEVVAEQEPEPEVVAEPVAETEQVAEEVVEPHGDAPVDTPEENSRLQDVADHIELLTEDDFVKTGPRAGKPKVAPLAEATGFADLTAEEVDAALALHEGAKGGAGEQPVTIGITVSVNGNYKAPVKVKHQNGEVTEFVVSGHGHPGPNVKWIDFYHGNNGSVVEVSVGPESQDNGEAEAS